MIDLFYMGGPLFMSILTIELIAIIGVAIFFFSKGDMIYLTLGNSLIRQIGLLAFITGILAQAIGLYDALKAIEAMGNVPPSMLAGGLKVSFICSIYGLIIYVLAIILAIVMKVKAKP